MTCVSLALLGSKGGWRKPETANIKSTSTGPKNGERLTASCGPDERIVRIPRWILVNAKADIPDKG